jgi:hypothetical protein
MHARVDHGQSRLLTRTGLDWTDKYLTTAKALGREGRGRFIHGSYITNQHTTCKKTPLGPLQAAQDAGTVMVHLGAA